jgi:nitrite reductase/ring-hydroxylating ferredoxin subunit/DMSO/TMAO reductase YedYZ heme-binding membrane subunit
MGAGYKTITWTPFKVRYDLFMVAGSVIYISLFAIFFVREDSTIETLIIRSTGTLAFFLLHLILCIGPLSRLNAKCLPLLYNRRHLGVFTFLVALVHGVFNIIQFHAWGDLDPILSLFISNVHYDSLINFPFQVLGFSALIIMSLLAFTSHDFWLKNLSPAIWKGLHMSVYAAYFLLVAHVLLGINIHQDSNTVFVLTATGIVIVSTLHIWSGIRSAQSNSTKGEILSNGYVFVCLLEDIKEKRAVIHRVGAEIAIYKYDGKISAISNVCSHQHGPIGEGQLINGCITCPWHGYQYNPENGQSPPPFTEQIKTYNSILIDRKIYVHPDSNPLGTVRPETIISP